MTYPQYQQSQGYGQQAPYQQQPPQQPPQQAAPPAYPQFGGQPIVPPVPQLGQGGAGGGGAAAPKPRHLVGRTVILEPIRIDETAMDTSTNPPTSRPEAYFNLTVVDGGPLQYGDNRDHDISKQRPNTFEIDTPCRFINVNERGTQIVAAMRDALNAGEVARAGVIEQGTKGNKPFMLTKCTDDVERNPRPGGDARYAAAMELFGKLWADKHAAPGAPKQFVSPEPRSLVAPPAQQSAPPVNYGAPAQQAPAYPAGYGQFGAPAAPLGTAHGGYYMPGQPAPAAAPSYPQYTPPVPAAPQLPPAVEAWLASLPADQAAGARGQYLAQQAAQPAPTGPGM